MMDAPKKDSIFNRIANLISKTIKFITYDIWRITGNEVGGLKKIYINTIKTCILAVRGFVNLQLSYKASALTYNTLLSIVPLFAIIIGIAKGFGFQNTLQQSLYDSLPGHEAQLNMIFNFVESYLQQIQGGVIIGVSLLVLFWTVISLISATETTFNEIWQIKKERAWFRKITDYMAIFLIIPILMITSSGLSIFLSTLQNSFLGDSVLFTPIVETILYVSPYFITILSFTALYIALPNTKVGFLNGLLAGVIAGTAFQLLQFFYFSGLIWVSKYNAIYGSFAALPLLLLWLQSSWLICLFGAEVAYSSQNVNKFSFERDCKNISRRFKDFLILLITSLIVKRFAEEKPPYTADEISTSYKIPLSLTTEILYFLTEINIIVEVNYGDDDRIIHYQPAIDINKLSIGLLFNRLEQFGSENFKVDTSNLFNKEWNTLVKSKEEFLKTNEQILIKDL
jgi:membrane protein